MFNVCEKLKFKKMNINLKKSYKEHLINKLS